MNQNSAPRESSSRPNAELPGALGLNAWLVEEMYQAYSADPSSVSESWREFFADYRSLIPSSASAPTNGEGAPSTVQEARRDVSIEQVPHAIAPPASASAEVAPTTVTPSPTVAASQDVAVVLRGTAARIAENMVASLTVPTATSVHPIPAKLLEVNRQLINEHLSRTSGGKVSFTHLIGYAIVRALNDVPAMNAAYVEDIDGTSHAGIVRHAHVALGIAIDLERSDGTRSLVVPAIRDADTLDFRGFFHAYEDLIFRARSNKLTVDDFSGVTISLTNPGTLGTTQSVPRLVRGQGAIIGVGAIGYPAEFGGADPEMLARLGIGKAVTLTSTYDHRIIQGAESGLFLSKVHELLAGDSDFYDEVFSSLGIPSRPARWERDRRSDAAATGGDIEKQIRVQALVNMYRVRGHLIAQLDPLSGEVPELRSDLDPATYGLTLWDLDRDFYTSGLAGRDVMSLSAILGILRDAYCRTVGVEYMHIQSPEEKQWIQSHVEGVSQTLTPQEQWHILERLNAAEAFERFLHSRYVGQKRFGLEGAEATIPFLDAVLEQATRSGIIEAVLGMAHRGRLNVLANIVGKSYGEIFAEFEGNLDPDTVQGSGDVKYHKGAVGKWVSRDGISLPISLASNPSHLEAVDPVVEGMARAKNDLLDNVSDLEFPILPILVHGDAAFAGQGVVAETLHLSMLEGYRTGGTIHLVINNQLGFTTPPTQARSSVYPTDVAKMVQLPIFHVNGDDPEACVRVARLAVDYRQEFHKDVVVDLVCYRLHGHNEGDDPSYTQPLMYKKIEAHRSVRKLYTESLVKRADITLAEAEQALEDFSKRLQSALDETRSTAPPKIDHLPDRQHVVASLSMRDDIGPELLDGISARLDAVPDHFTVHPKLKRQLEQRSELYRAGEVDWSLAEALAIGSLLVEGIDVRLTGQDTRRGTFSHRHAVLVDYDTGAEYTPLMSLGAPNTKPLPLERGVNPGRLFVRDSLLSEYAALGFEYGYSVESRDALVIWEAQFGDFANGAQIIIDNFLVAAEEKWGQRSGLVLLLPHGYEGQGAEHSSARLERFLTLAAGGNITVAQPTTAGQYFHMLRSQAHLSERRPLIVMTPKWLLRARSARSKRDDLAVGSWQEVLDDPVLGQRDELSMVERVVCCTGKIAYDAIERRDLIASGSSDRARCAVVRVEQLYPWPEDLLTKILDRYSGATELVWLQDEPENMGAWNTVHSQLHRIVRDRFALRHVSRAASGSPATGSHAIHELELEDLLTRAVGPRPVSATPATS